MLTALQICGYRVPKGTTVLYAPWALHHNRRVWGEDASQWRPDRWLEGNSVAAAKKAAGGLPRFMPFSAGAQNCIGQALAMVRIRQTRPKPVCATVTRRRSCLPALLSGMAVV